MRGFFKSFGLKALVAVIAWAAGFGIVYTYADEASPSQDSPTFTTIRGVARFERHRTVTPDYCTQVGCAQAQTYWALVIDAKSGMHYELNKIFDAGQTQAPDSIELDQVAIRPGMQLILQGRVDVESRAYAVVSEVQSVQVDRPENMQLNLVTDSGGAPFFGWTCRSVGEVLPIYVDVEQISRGGIYAMRVQSEVSRDDSSLRTLAAFDSVSFNITSATIGFSGTTQLLHADLEIDQRSGRFNALDSILRIRGKVRSSDPEIPFEIPSKRAVRLICDRTR